MNDVILNETWNVDDWWWILMNDETMDVDCVWLEWCMGLLCEWCWICNECCEWIELVWFEVVVEILKMIVFESLWWLMSVWRDVNLNEMWG